MSLYKIESLNKLRKMQAAVIPQIKMENNKSKKTELMRSLNEVNQQYSNVLKRKKGLTQNPFEALGQI